MKLYRIADRPNHEEREALGVTVAESRPYLSAGIAPTRVQAQATGEKRPPRKGEWYLSGAIIEAYRAPNDLSTPYHIARLVKVKMTTTIITEIEAALL